MDPVPVTPGTRLSLSELPLEPAPRSRLSLGTGAAVLLVLVTLAAAVLIAMLQPQGGEHPVPEALGGTAAWSDTGAASLTAEGFGAAELDEAASGAAPLGSGAAQTSRPGILVHVLGAVAEPGVYTLSEGARAVDAVAAAGGFSKDADPGGINLAQPVGDGEQLRMPRRGEDAASGTSGAGAAADGSASGSAGKVALNSADAAALQSLPGIGPALAQRILQWRAANGRFRSVDELMDISGIGRKTFEGLRSRVTL